jgi:hypothetical protein
MRARTNPRAYTQAGPVQLQTIQQATSGISHHDAITGSLTHSLIYFLSSFGAISQQVAGALLDQ